MIILDFDQYCFGYGVGWSALQGAAADSTLAGVLAGFLIAAAAALLVQWYHTIGLFALLASGVPALMLSSYLFTVLTGTKPPYDYDPKVCGQIWSQWLLSFAMLLIGGSVLLCGLGWALVSYSDNLAVKLIEKNRPMKSIAQNRRFFISLSACLSLGATTGTTCWLIAANALYLKTPTWQSARYAMFFVFLFGLYVMVRSAYLVIWRTTTAWRENVESCTRYVPGVYTTSPTPLGPRDNKPAKHVAKEICIAVVIALGALLAIYLTNHAVRDKFSGNTTCYIVGVVVVAYAIARLAYCIIVQYIDSKLRGQTATNKTANRYAEADAMIRRTPSTEKPEDAIRINYSFLRRSQTSYHVVFFAILGTAFAWALTQGPLWTNLRTGLSLFIGGIYPAMILLGLSYSVPAGPGARLPEWKTWPGSRLLP